MSLFDLANATWSLEGAFKATNPVFQGEIAKSSFNRGDKYGDDSPAYCVRMMDNTDELKSLDTMATYCIQVRAVMGQESSTHMRAREVWAEMGIFWRSERRGVVIRSIWSCAGCGKTPVQDESKKGAPQTAREHAAACEAAKALVAKGMLETLAAIEKKSGK